MEENTKRQYLYGMHPVLEAVRAGKKFDKVLLRQGLENPQFRELMELLQKNGIPYQFVPVEKLNHTVRGAHQGVIACIASIDYISIEEMVDTALAVTPSPLIAILDGVSDVRNLGAISRTLECAGGNGIIVPAKGGAAINADAIKSSAGALMRIGISKVPNLRYAVYYLKQSGFSIVAATEKAEQVYTDANLKEACAIILGSEDTGIDEELLSLSNERIKIPQFGKIESLNVSAAAAVLVYEAVRQRKS